MKMFKNIRILFILLGVIVASSCTDYLDKEPSADLTEENVFTSFRNFQGYVEVMYGDIINLTASSDGRAVRNIGDDMSPKDAGFGFIDGNYRKIFGAREFWFWSSLAQRSWRGTRNAIWQNSWWGIRSANIALANIDMLVEATDPGNQLLAEQKRLIEGQAYFFRGYFHMELIRAWGDIPYIDMEFVGGEIPNVPQLGLYNTIEKVVADLDKAIDLLPFDWDDIATGQLTLNQNIGRVTKGTALAVKAQALLYAASPLFNGTVTGNYEYNIEYAKESAEAAWQVIKLANEEGVYALEPWETYSDIFYRWDGTIPKSKEHILMEVVRGIAAYEWQQFNPSPGEQTTSPTENYVSRFGMANGLPIDDPDSGFDENNPWENREPRFYYNHWLDGDRIATTINDDRAFVRYYEGRTPQVGRTGYGHRKYMDENVNWYDGHIGFWYYRVPHLRFSEMYLIYAEMANEAYGPHGVHPGADISAVDAINIIRNRAGVPNVNAKYTGSIEVFRERIWDERAVELAYEAKRWYDIRRWHVGHLPEYKEKYKLEFDADHTYFKKVLLETTVFEERHYWLPFPDEQIKLYPEWKQNPGW